MNTENLKQKLGDILSEESLTLLLGSEALQDLLQRNEDLSNDYDNIKEDVDRYKKENSVLIEQRNRAQKEVLELEGLRQKIEAREKVVVEAEFEHRVREVKLECQTERGNEMKSIVDGFTRNTVVRQNVLGGNMITSPGAFTGPNGEWIEGKNENHSTHSDSSSQAE